MALNGRLKSMLALTRVPSAEPYRILLTFDDGPHQAVTPRVLNLLAKFNATAIFFIVGAHVKLAPHMLKEVLACGHLLGNHSYSHQPDLGLRAYVRDLRKTQTLIDATVGTWPKFFRPPEGRFTLASTFSPRLLRLSTMLWSLDSNDWRLCRADDVPCCANRILDHFRCNGLNRDIILFHDDNEFTPSVLDRVLVELTAMGADLRTVTNLQQVVDGP